MMPAEHGYIRSLSDLPDWFSNLRGFEVLVGMLVDTELGRLNEDDMWELALSLPADLTEAVEEVDPLIVAVIVAHAHGRVAEKLAETVEVCLAQGKSFDEVLAAGVPESLVVRR